LTKNRKRPTVKVGGFILSEQIRIGDVVRITTASGDMVSSNTGKVGKREHVGQRGVSFYTPHGQLLGTDWRDGSTFKARLIKNAEILESVVLEGFDTLTERIENR